VKGKKSQDQSPETKVWITRKNECAYVTVVQNTAQNIVILPLATDAKVTYYIYKLQRKG